VEAQGRRRRTRRWPLVAPPAERGRQTARDGLERGYAHAEDQFWGSRLPARHTRRHPGHQQGVQEEPFNQLQQDL